MDSRCCERPSGSCSRSSGSSSCILPPPAWCRCHTSDRSCSGCARPTPTEPEPQLLEDERREPKNNGSHIKSVALVKNRKKYTVSSSPASSSLNFSRSLLGDFGKEQYFSLQRLRSSAASSSVPMANQAGGSWTPSSDGEEEGFFFLSTPRKMSMVAGF